MSEAIETLGQALLREVAQKALAVGRKPEVGAKVGDLPLVAVRQLVAGQGRKAEGARL